MARRPKWLYERFGPGPLPKYLEEAAKGRGVSLDFWDRCFWLDDPDVERWVRALEAVDKRGDKGPLLRMLKSESDLPQRARLYLADLLDRYVLKVPSNRPRTPAYDRTLTEMVLLLGVKRARDFVEDGESVKDALSKASAECGIPLEILSNAYEGRRGASRRASGKRSRP
jgi:hypothetical protein